ncbi:MAG TPA: NADH-quinone oxidoreductase subunit J, partial [Anaerolineales bacterium]|nr:NADH-quinone oxidoreductase subunit J [Anaerolineales bacterium]
AIILVIEGIYLMIAQKAPGIINNNPSEDFGSPQAIGDMLFTDYLLPFEATSILLLVAMVGAIVLTVKKKKGAQK